MYDEQHMEVIIYKYEPSRQSYNYTIRFNPNHMMFFRVGGGFTGHYVSKGVYYGMNGSVVYNMNKDVQSVENVHVGLQTNPVVHAARNLKKLNQSRLSGYILVPPSDMGLHYKVYGSNRYSVNSGLSDGFAKKTVFSLIQEYVLSDQAGSVEPLTVDTDGYTADTDEITSDAVSVVVDSSGVLDGTHEISMLTGRAYQSVIYLLYRFGGIVRSDSVISEIQTSIEDRFAKKMR
jgi:hypothetical protein